MSVNLLFFRARCCLKRLSSSRSHRRRGPAVPSQMQSGRSYDSAAPLLRRIHYRHAPAISTGKVRDGESRFSSESNNQPARLGRSDEKPSQRCSAACTCEETNNCPDHACRRPLGVPPFGRPLATRGGAAAADRAKFPLRLAFLCSTLIARRETLAMERKTACLLLSLLLLLPPTPKDRATPTPT